MFPIKILGGIDDIFERDARSERPAKHMAEGLGSQIDQREHPKNPGPRYPSVQGKRPEWCAFAETLPQGGFRTQ